MLKAASLTRLFYWRNDVRAVGCIFFFVLLATHAFAAENQPAMEQDTSGRGAILCMHELIAVTVAFARVCKEDRKAEIKRLETAIKRFEAFEVKHGGWSILQARGYTYAAIRRAFPGETGLNCNGISKNNLALLESFYTGFGGPDSKILVDNALSVARKPVMNPCFRKLE
jgi:hypothetical protein